MFDVLTTRTLRQEALTQSVMYIERETRIISMLWYSVGLDHGERCDRIIDRRSYSSRYK